jgi:hypothetical protein
MDAMGGEVRPPRADELPGKRWLAYGSSITQAAGTFHNYVNTAAQVLNVDALNLGMGGSCWLEPAVADFIASRQDWDIASFELGVNMRNLRDNPDFKKRVSYLLETVTTAHPDKPIVLITHFRNAEHHEQSAGDTARDQQEKDDILREAAVRFPDQITLVEGTDIATDLRGFKLDLLHPEPIAYVRMGMNLAEQMRPLM